MTTILTSVPSVGFESEAGGLFDLVGGVPVHPLVVHLAVVIVPLAAIGLIVMASSRGFSRKFGWLVLLMSIVAAGGSFVAKEAGEALVARVGAPGFDHAELGDLMPIFAGVLVVATLVLWLIDRTGPAEQPSNRGLRTAVAVVAVLVAAANLIWIFRVGHSGAKSVWADAVAEGPAAVESTPTPSPTGTPVGSATATATSTGVATATAASYTMAQVAGHSTASDCWVAINGNVYDLTTWEDLHPGGAKRITDLCGTDGTTAFQDQHDSQSKPNNALAKYEIGTLS